ncbi:Nucleic acid-binding [Perilla frutescens var. frutescens]|nr:Nucleic acid-binding [Perilla frutescens var. frutescens]
MAAATALSSAPFLLSCRRHYRRCTLLFPSITGGRLINNRHSQFTPLVLNSNPIDNVNTGGVKEAANSLDIRVGRIVKAWRHEEADSLYVEEVDVGESEPRTICSGLVKYIPLHLLQERNVVVLANLKPRNMRGVKSFGMLMAASDASHENVELLVPPEGALPGDRVWFGSIDDKDNLPDVASPNQVQKKKIWELVQPHLKTDDSRVATLEAKHCMRTSAGLIISESLKNANIS